MSVGLASLTVPSPVKRDTVILWNLPQQGLLIRQTMNLSSTLMLFGCILLIKFRHIRFCCIAFMNIDSITKSNRTSLGNRMSSIQCIVILEMV